MFQISYDYRRSWEDLDTDIAERLPRCPVGIVLRTPGMSEFVEGFFIDGKEKAGYIRFVMLTEDDRSYRRIFCGMDQETEKIWDELAADNQRDEDNGLGFADLSTDPGFQFEVFGWCLAVRCA